MALLKSHSTEAKVEGRSFEIADAKNKNETDNTLKEFGKCAVALCEALQEDRPLNAMELLFIDNHLQIVQMTYLRWKRKHQTSSPE
jgi:hypothetical protein